jgi:hypothetical protein
MYRTVCITYFLNDNKFGEKYILLYLLECAVPVKMPPKTTKTNMLPFLSQHPTSTKQKVINMYST